MFWIPFTVAHSYALGPHTSRGADTSYGLLSLAAAAFRTAHGESAKTRARPNFCCFPGFPPSRAHMPPPLPSLWAHVCTEPSSTALAPSLCPQAREAVPFHSLCYLHNEAFQKPHSLHSSGLACASMPRPLHRGLAGLKSTRTGPGSLYRRDIGHQVIIVLTGRLVPRRMLPSISGLDPLNACPRGPQMCPDITKCPSENQ